jgi:hypothetical protein
MINEPKFCVNCRHQEIDEDDRQWCMRNVVFEHDLVSGVRNGRGPRYNCREERYPPKSKYAGVRCGAAGQYFSSSGVFEK